MSAKLERHASSASARPAMCLRAIWREACRNLLTGPSRTVALTLVLAACMIGAITVDWLQIRNLESNAAAWVSAGASTYVITAPGHIDGQTCSRLQAVDGVLAAGAFRSVDTRTVLAAFPSTGVPTYQTTPNAVTVFDIASNGLRADGASSSARGLGDGMGIVLSREAADLIGADAGDRLALADGRQTTVTAVYDYPDDGRASGYGYAALEPVPENGMFDSCMVAAWPIPDDLDALLRYTVGDVEPSAAADVNESDSSQSVDATISQLNATLGTVPPSASSFRHRLTGMAFIVVTVVALLAAGASAWSRRVELASALHAGYRRIALITQLTMETTAICCAGMMLSLPLAAYAVTASQTGDRLAMAVALARIVVAVDAGALAGTMLVAAGVRERLLFRFFKER
ncbi:ABC transporter permease [uncultured Bifidobacterium sp.]|uniref:ABC transporter permease n=1 Tax=uncultured Bifidobacterium sp. TaxID=165187 RepID=UPI002591C05E|nr:hypothetical protein [uncultured Bifidobacterium sp.]